MPTSRFCSVFSAAHSRTPASVARRSSEVPLSAKNTLSTCSDSKTGSALGAASQAASAFRPAAVIEYTVRGRLPCESDSALASPCATSFFGSS